MEVMAWAEQGKNLQCRNNLQGLYNAGIASCSDVLKGGVYMLCYDKTLNIEYNPEKNEYNDLLCLSGNIQSSMRDRWGSPGSKAEVTLARLLYQYSNRLSTVDKNRIKSDIAKQAKSKYYIKSGPLHPSELETHSEVIAFLGILEDKSASMEYGKSTGSYDFTYAGRSYTKGSTYNAFELRRDWLYAWFDRVVDISKSEQDSNYQNLAIEPLFLLYDFADRTGDAVGQEMKKRSKMMADFLLLDFLGEYSAGHQGGINGRYYRRHVNGASLNFPYWAVLGVGTDGHSAYLLSSYRLPGIIKDIVQIDLKSDSYWHLVFEKGGKSTVKNKMTFVTKNYNLGSSRGSGNRWLLNVLTDKGIKGRPFTLWINNDAGDADIDACPKSGNVVKNECYFEQGQKGYQYKNALLLDTPNPILHIAMKDGDGFDPGSDSLQPFGEWKNDYKLSSGWNFFKKGKTMIAIDWKSSGGWMGLEVATEGVEYPSFQAFKSASRSVTSGKFVTGKGDEIKFQSGSVVVNGNPYIPGDFSRLKITDNSNNQLVSWQEKKMTVKKGTKQCTYDFTAWSYSGNGCGGGDGGPSCTQGSACITYENCPGTYDSGCNCQDVSGDDCPEPLSCTVNSACTTADSCPGTYNSNCACIDSSGDNCPTTNNTDPPESCIELGGHGCTQTIDNWEIPFPSGDSYCSKMSAKLTFCITCNIGQYNKTTHDCPREYSTDINNDGTTDILDLVLVVKAFGTDKYDITGDNKVGIDDLILIIQKL